MVKPRAAGAAKSDSMIEHLRQTVEEALSGLSGIGSRKMLVSAGWTVNDRVFALVNRDARIVVRLPDETAEQELLALPGSGPWKYGKRAPPRGWLLLPESMHDGGAELASWLRRAWQLARDVKARPAPKKKKTEFALFTMKDGKIVEERFFYGG